jgi:hypothetical protein
MIKKNNDVTVTIPIDQYEEYKSLLEYKKEIESGKGYIIRNYEVVTNSNYNPNYFRNEISYDYHFKLNFITTDEAVKVAVDKTNETIKLLDEQKESNEKVILEYNRITKDLKSELNKLSKFKSLMENMSVWDFLKIKCKSTEE